MGRDVPGLFLYAKYDTTGFAEVGALFADNRLNAEPAHKPVDPFVVYDESLTTQSHNHAAVTVKWTE